MYPNLNIELARLNEIIDISIDNDNVQFSFGLGGKIYRLQFAVNKSTKSKSISMFDNEWNVIWSVPINL